MKQVCCTYDLRVRFLPIEALCKELSEYLKLSRGAEVCQSFARVRHRSIAKLGQDGAARYRVFSSRAFLIRNSFVTLRAGLYVCLLWDTHWPHSLLCNLQTFFIPPDCFLLSLRAHDICLQSKMAAAWNQIKITNINMDTLCQEVNETPGFGC
jgi:hypothetical protein